MHAAHQAPEALVSRRAPYYPDQCARSRLEHRCGDQHEHRWSDLARLRPLQFAAPLPGVSPGGFAELSSVRRCCEPYSAGVEPAGGWPCETAV